ncbi:MAG: hypothetical protein JRN57_00200 [Nitrososphaerota archaeon]|nr:hypothetical protein [Nitrososphaerota archaeon]
MKAEERELPGKAVTVEVTYLVHETEDEGRIDSAVGELIGSPGPYEKQALEGHFGNRILRARVHLTGGDADGAVGRIMGALPAEARRRISSSIGSMLDERSAFYLRLDKQSLVSGAAALGTGDAVRIRVKPKWLPRDRAEEFYLGLLGGG